MVIDAVMHDAKADAVEINDLVFLVIHFGRSVEEFGARRAEIGAARRRGVVTIARRWRNRMKILRLGEGLTDEARSDDLAANRNEATIGLLRENKLGHTGHYRRIEQSSENRK